MIEDLYVVKYGKRLRCGYTTGSCAAGASKAAVLMESEKRQIDIIQIDTPANIPVKLRVNNQKFGKDWASCSITKNAGDDPDSTDGIEIFAFIKKRNDGIISIDGGEGIGRIKRKGLFGELGEAAINPVPRQMIKNEIRKVSSSGYHVIISAPRGECVALKTFNKNIGVEGGISIIGTKGIVYPMSDDAIKKTIYLEVDMVKEKHGRESIVLVLGNHGETIAQSLYKDIPRVKVSNYIGDSLLYVYNKGFKSIILLGHIGKLSKLSIGIFNTHSKVSDSRVEAFVYYLSLGGAPRDFLKRVDECLTAEEALNICIDSNYEEIVKDMVKGCEERIKLYLKDEDYSIKVVFFTMEGGIHMG